MAVQALPPRTFRACGDAQPILASLGLHDFADLGELIDFGANILDINEQFAGCSVRRLAPALRRR